MEDSLVPATYAAWRHCIEVECGLRLEAGYIRQRIAALEDAADHHTQQLVRRWGEPHRQRVVAWFQRARDELDAQLHS